MKSSGRVSCDKNTERKRYDDRALRALSGTLADAKVALGAAGMRLFLREPYLRYADLIARTFSVGDRVCELGAGSGLQTEALLHTGAQVVAVDISSASLRLLRARYREFEGTLCTLCADIEALPFADRSLNGVVSAGSLSYGRSDIIFSEIVRVLKPGGAYICVDSLNDNPIYRFNRWIHYLLGHRTVGTLRNMPDLQSLRRMQPHLVTEQIQFYGCLIWLAPLLVRLAGETHASRLISAFDRVVGVRRSAFKFVLSARRSAEPAISSNPSRSIMSGHDAVQIEWSEEYRYHFASVPRFSAEAQSVIDLALLCRRLARDLPDSLTVSCDGPFALLWNTEVGWRGIVLLCWLRLNNLARINLFIIVVRDRGGSLVHRSTVVRRDPRKRCLGEGLEVTQVWTHPAYRGRRIARLVLGALLVAAPGVQIHWVVRPSNRSSIAVVEHFGFTWKGCLVARRCFGVSYYDYSDGAERA